ncbi:signal transduction histidine kinase [Clostridium tetanomorphum]|uniref:histidine kinase n=1 Tax=Clostridium tetanomorphum TaxID=1553 RepID=A0A923EF45_CLOTT|nr:ATP-binding protein [Clostridium tetanomorphum]KAJ50549.1 histidine kinase with HAMP domain [Clostridium tetanomorphum DSM 665]MBC2400143.1 GHKL domain-containing protein [Clostridium tetanomorphum]MBP1866531.1 signal transduction histidine kinase [Clostridium tetanomorphum]NRS86528.1 signal transduction histidine kinase [Clostridium tetanomorphum]NRZ95443.1 signal transduction histidine kinase [Clostridium tetanomorphum]
MKIYKGITFKLFIILISFLLFFMGILVYVQIFVVGRLYMTTEYAQEMEKKLYNKLLETDFFGSYTYINLYCPLNKDSAIMKEVKNYENVNKAYLIIFDKDFKLKYITDSAKKNLSKSNLNYISKNLSNGPIDSIVTHKFDNSQHRTFSVSNGDSEKYYPFTFSIGHKQTFRVYGKFSPSKYIAISTPIQLNKNDVNNIVIIMPEVFTSKSSLILKKYVLYIIIASIICILILSAIFSYLITKPIIGINNVASKMINLDFSAKCNVKSDDEIGNLSKSLNYLSGKLNDTIESLYLANNQLKKDLDLQKELDLLRKDFIASVSHEFKTPITLIKGYTESLKDNVAEECEKEDIYNIITTEVDKMDRLIQDLLDLSQMETDRYTLNITEFYIDELLEYIIKKYILLLKEKNINFEVSIESKNILVSGDSFKIEQVITNFLNNAITYTQKNKKITVYLKKEENLVCFSVENEGTHIPDEDIEKIWEKFYRVDKSRSHHSGGTGLGLAICKVILDHHETIYGAENTPTGVKFYFKLNCFNK